MESLIKLVRKFQNAKNVKGKVLEGEKVVKWVGPALNAFIVKHCRASSRTEDVLQETLRAIFLRLDSFEKGTNEAFWSWCYSIARHKICDAGRGQWVTRVVTMAPEELQGTIEAGSPHTPVAPGDRLDLDDAMELLRKADPKCFEYLWRRYVEKTDILSLAKEYGIEPDAMRMRIQRCKEPAQKLLANRK